jgi:hypothetical protein
MPDYDFRALSSVEFEDLVRDLLQKELQVRLQGFATGRDNGIDLRYAPSNGNELVVQCKHYAGSKFALLLHHTQESELPKIKRLNPPRYVLATSLGLTPTNKDSLLEILSPYCQSTQDILGRTDLNNLLGRFPDVEQSAFKLWLNSKSVLDRVLNGGIVNRTESELRSIMEKLPLYVQNDSYPEAQAILDEHHVCIIAGIPGIGKTTLAEVLLVERVNRGAQAVVIGSDVREGFEMFNPEIDQVFYYDDFLGQTSLELKLNKNEDRELIRFIELIRQSPRSRFVLTTREYILNQAQLLYERLANADVDVHKCVMNLSKYSRFARARILFNHIYHSNLPGAYRDAVLADRAYLRILDHSNYSPRIVEWMTDAGHMRGVPPQEYADAFMANLHDPARLWAHAFEEQLSSHTQALLLVLLTFGGEALIEDLKSAFETYCSVYVPAHVSGSSDKAFRRAIREGDGNFISTDSDGQHTVVRFHNPSVRDFLANYVAAQPQIVAGLAASAIYFRQCQCMWQERGPHGNHAIREVIRRKCAPDYVEAVRRTFESEETVVRRHRDSYRRHDSYSRGFFSLQPRLVFAIEVMSRTGLSGTANAVAEMVTRTLDELRDCGSVDDDTVELGRASSDSAVLSSLQRHMLSEAVRQAFLQNMSNEYELWFFTELQTRVPGFFTDADVERACSALESCSFEYPGSSWFTSPSDVSDYIDTIEQTAARLDVDLGDALDELRMFRSDWLERLEEQSDDRRDYRAVASAGESDTEIVSMFDALSD